MCTQRSTNTIWSSIKKGRERSIPRLAQAVIMWRAHCKSQLNHSTNSFLAPALTETLRSLEARLRLADLGQVAIKHSLTIDAILWPLWAKKDPLICFRSLRPTQGHQITPTCKLADAGSHRFKHSAKLKRGSCSRHLRITMALVCTNKKQRSNGITSWVHRLNLRQNGHFPCSFFKSIKRAVLRPAHTKCGVPSRSL